MNNTQNIKRKLSELREIYENDFLLRLIQDLASLEKEEVFVLVDCSIRVRALRELTDNAKELGLIY